MIIDFHTHIFPDKIAAKTIEYLEGTFDGKAYTRGTLAELLEEMNDAEVDLSVVLPVVTNPKQFDSINRFACEVSKMPGIISFGGIHPESANWKNEIDQIVEMGLPGIKLHPDYQKAYVDEEATVRLVQYAISKGLHVVFHSGVDVGFPNPVHCTPKRARTLLDQLERKPSYGQIIFAHIGGHEMWDEVEANLVGENCYFDLAYGLGKIEDEQLLRIIKSHGCERILFATDSPWDSQSADVAYLKSFEGITDECKEKIFSKNARKLLNLVTE